MYISVRRNSVAPPYSNSQATHLENEMRYSKSQLRVPPIKLSLKLLSVAPAATHLQCPLLLCIHPNSVPLVYTSTLSPSRLWHYCLISFEHISADTHTSSTRHSQKPQQPLVPGTDAIPSPLLPRSCYTWHKLVPVIFHRIEQ